MGELRVGEHFTLLGNKCFLVLTVHGGRDEAGKGKGVMGRLKHMHKEWFE